MYKLSWLPSTTGNHAERKGVLGHALRLERERGSDIGAARIQRPQSDVNRHMGLYDEGIQQAKEAPEIYERPGDAAGQVRCFIQLAWLLWEQERLDAAEEAASRAINFWSANLRLFSVTYIGPRARPGRPFTISRQLKIASSLDWHHELFEIHSFLAQQSLDGSRFDSANVHAERARLYVVDDVYNLGQAMFLQAVVWYRQDRLEEARSEALRAAEIFGKLGSPLDMEICRKLLECIQRAE